MDLTKAEQDLNAARIAFNVARMQLDHHISTLAHREASADRMIFTAEEYGLDRALTLLQHNPAQFELGKAPDGKALEAIGQSLTEAYNANKQLDLAMANREDALRGNNPNHAKRVAFAGGEVTVDMETGTVTYADGRTELEDMELVYPTDENTRDTAHDDERER